MEKKYCTECRTDATYSIEHKKMNCTLKEQLIEYEGDIAYCDNCGSEVWVPELHDSNLRNIYDEYRILNQLITPEMIKEVIEKYCIGKRPLSLLLGWGEHTVSRYLDGHIPSKQYSDELMRIYNEPSYYLLLLGRNKDNLASQLTYNKSKRAVEFILSQHSNIASNIYNIVDYVLFKGKDITHMTLQKALYYIQGFYYAFYEDYLIEEDCEAWAHGPVYRNIYSLYSNYNYEKIDKPEIIDDITFTNMEKGLIDNIIKYFCCYSGKVLEEFSHQEKPWLLARKGLPATEPSNEIINKNDIGNYFSLIKEKYNMCNPTDVQLYAVDMFERVNG